MCLLPTKKVSHSRNETPVHSLYNLIFSPFGRSASLLSLEKAVEIGAGGESAFERDDVVGIVRIFQHHLFCRIETYAASHILKVEFKHWSKNAVSSSLVMPIASERVSMFTVLSL